MEPCNFFVIFPKLRLYVFIPKFLIKGMILVVEHVEDCKIL